MEKQKAMDLGLKPVCEIVAQSVAAVDPRFMGIGPVFAVPKALEAAGL
jgi:acetyl-CoA acyltransferase